MTFPALLDTCVLYPAYLCDTLLRLAEAEAYRPLWSFDIVRELCYWPVPGSVKLTQVGMLSASA